MALVINKLKMIQNLLQGIVAQGCFYCSKNLLSKSDSNLSADTIDDLDYYATRDCVDICHNDFAFQT